MQAFRDISSWCDQFSLPKTISDIAKQLYRRADEEKLLQGKNLDAVIAACIFIMVAKPMSRGHSKRFAILCMSGAVGKVLTDGEMAIKLQVCS